MRELYGELLGVRPGELGEFLDGDPAAEVVVLEAALVDHIGGLLAALGDDEVGAEVVRRRFQLRKRELRESRPRYGVVSVGQFRSTLAARKRRRGVKRRGRALVLLLLLLSVVVVLLFPPPPPPQPSQ